jgi:hypothetical protein
MTEDVGFLQGRDACRWMTLVDEDRHHAMRTPKVYSGKGATCAGKCINMIVGERQQVGRSGLGSANPWVQSHGRRAAHRSEKGVHARASHQEQQTWLVACQFGRSP